jgi:glycosyltransferase involved in cell wall biosynthesis
LKILWLSHSVLSDSDRGSTGTWLRAMAHQLVASGDVTLGNISSAKVRNLTRQDLGAIRQWMFPASVPSPRDGLPPQKVVVAIIKIVDEFAPDLVHVWGVESFLGLLTARRLIRQQSLLEMQGLKGAYARVYNGGLTASDQLRCIGLKEILRQSTIYQGRRHFVNWGKFESEMIASHRFITTQSAWMEAQVKAINNESRTYHMDLALRSSFLAANRWKRQDTSQIFCSAAYAVPYKGLHVALRAVALLKARFPHIALRIAGHHQATGIRRDGYVHWLKLMIKRLGIEHNVIWLGEISGDQIAHEMLECAAMVIPTFIENCCTAMQEAMMMGIPVVASYVGGLPSLARDEESALFFPPGDDVMCAHQIERVLSDSELAVSLSRRAQEIASERNDPEKITSRQLEIYRQVIAESKQEGV